MSETPIEGESQRLAELKAGLFTSDLAVDEFLLLRQCGFKPLGMVMGSSVYHIGIQVGRWKQSFELDTMSRAMHDARALAMERMRAEAETLGADGVVGTDLLLHTYVGGQSVLEFLAVGTAVRYDAAPQSLFATDGKPFTSAVSGQDFVKLWRAGFVPTHFSFGVCVYHVAHQSIRDSVRQVGQNIEMPLYTQAIYSAREIAMERMQTEAKSFGSVGVVGADLVVANHVWGEHAVEFAALGTGVRKHGQPVTVLNDPTYIVSMDATS